MASYRTHTYRPFCRPPSFWKRAACSVNIGSISHSTLCLSHWYQIIPRFVGDHYCFVTNSMSNRTFPVDDFYGFSIMMIGCRRSWRKWYGTMYYFIVVGLSRDRVRTAAQAPALPTAPAPIPVNWDHISRCWKSINLFHFEQSYEVTFPSHV